MQITDIPSWLAGAWSISEAVAQIILSIVVLAAILFPVLYLARGKNATMIYVITLFLTECFLVGVGWLPFWVLIATVTMGAFSVAMIGSKAVTGG